MKLAFYKFTNAYFNKVEIYVFDDDLVDVICNEIKDTFESLKIEQTMFEIRYDYSLNFGTPRTIWVETFFNDQEFDESMVWKKLEQDLLKYDDIVLKENSIIYY